MLLNISLYSNYIALRLCHVIHTVSCLWKLLKLFSSLIYCQYFYILMCIRIECTHSVMSDSLQPHGHQPIRLLYPLNFPDKSTTVGCHLLLQRIFQTQGSNPHLLWLLHQQANFLPLSHLGSQYNANFVHFNVHLSKIYFLGCSIYQIEFQYFKILLYLIFFRFLLSVSQVGVSKISSVTIENLADITLTNFSVSITCY